MASNSQPRGAGLLLVVFLLSATSLPLARSFSYTQYRTVFSLSHSLLTRVVNLRAARGDLSGSERARKVADKLERGMGLGFLGMAWSVGWDYFRNYAWTGLDTGELCGAISDVNELMGFVAELSRADSDASRVELLRRIYGNVLRVSKRMLRRLLRVFARSGALREMVEVVQVEVVEGGLLRDCLEIGSSDLKGLLEILKEMALQYYTSPNKSQDL